MMVGYARVSTADQPSEGQVTRLRWPPLRSCESLPLTHTITQPPNSPPAAAGLAQARRAPGIVRGVLLPRRIARQGTALSTDASRSEEAHKSALRSCFAQRANRLKTPGVV